MLPDQCLNTKMLTFIRLRLTTAVQLACTLVLRFRRQNVLLVTGFHHSGTSVVQHSSQDAACMHGTLLRIRLAYQSKFQTWQVLSLAMTAPKGTTLLFKCPSNQVETSSISANHVLICCARANHSVSRGCFIVRIQPVATLPDSDLRMHVLHFVLVSRRGGRARWMRSHFTFEDFSKARLHWAFDSSSVGVCMAPAIAKCRGRTAAPQIWTMRT